MRHGRGIVVERGGDRHGRIEQNDIIALQTGFAVGNQNELRNGIIDCLTGAYVQHGLPAGLLDAQLRARWRRDAAHAGLEAEAVCRCGRRQVEEGNRGVQGLPEK